VRKDTLATRKLIINAAETLFATRGVENTSLLEIAIAAGQKNRSALQYHFTNKEGLLDAVLDKHARGIAVARMAMLDELEQSGDYTLYQLIEALVLPMAAQLDDDDGGHAFIKIHSHLMTSDDYPDLRKRRDQDVNDVLRLECMIRQRVATDNQEVIQARNVLAGCLLIHGLASYPALAGRIARPVFLQTLIQGIVDLLQQPIPAN
jgi:AcrR family transcriptional regulator